MKKFMCILLSVLMIISTSIISTSAYAATPITSKISISSKKSTKRFHFIHAMRIVERKAATCSSNGYIKYKCYKCNRTSKTIIKAKPHTIVIDKAVPATCTESGLTEGSHCSVCGRIIKSQKPISPLGHIEVIDESVPRTCVENGLTEGSHCSRCGEILVEQKEIKARGKHGLPYVEVISPATPEQNGEFLMICCDCDTVLSDEISYAPSKIALYETSGSSQIYKKNYTYTGNPIEPYVKVYDSKGQKIHDCTYTVAYYNNINPGTAKVIIDFNEDDDGIYEGTIEAEFTIVK